MSEVELTEAQRRRLQSLFERHAIKDFKGALLAQLSNTGQTMTVVCLTEQGRERLHDMFTDPTVVEQF